VGRINIGKLYRLQLKVVTPKHGLIHENRLAIIKSIAWFGVTSSDNNLKIFHEVYFWAYSSKDDLEDVKGKYGDKHET
jgi:hypothetical protein